MVLHMFMIAAYCLIDEWLPTQPRPCWRGPHPTLSDSEVLTIEVVGAYLGLDTDSARYRHFRRSGRSTGRASRQRANLWRIKEGR